MLKPILFCDVDGVIRARDGKTYSGNPSDFNPETHYDMDQHTVFTDRDDPWLFHYSTEMVKELRSLIEDDLVEFKWNTNWRSYAVSRLNPMFNFPDHITFLDIAYDKKAYAQEYKGHGISSFLADTPERPFIWLDDVATASFVDGINQNKFDHLTGERLIIQTKEQYALSRADIAEIRKFASKF